MGKAALGLLTVLICGGALAQESGEHSGPVEWKSWQAHTDIANKASLQRGARNFVNYCLGCHSLQYMRYNRLAADLGLTEEQLTSNFMFSGGRPFDIMKTAMPTADSANWFGKTPPDLTLIARARGTDYLYQFLKTFYLDPERPTGVNNLALENVAMPAVLADLQGTQKAVFVLEKKNEGNGEQMVRVFDHFEQAAPGRMSAAEFDDFVRDTVNFLDYVGEPVREKRESLGLWVVLFLLVFTGFAWALKKEVWKDVH
jgi:ubiquinol-cytochrome c reductase cytochrome c1 subunit